MKTWLEEEDVLIALTSNGYIKRMTPDANSKSKTVVAVKGMDEW